MRELEAQVRVCPLCKLSKTRTNVVPGEGSLQAEVMFIGEGPGYHEDRQGRPSVGATLVLGGPNGFVSRQPFTASPDRPPPSPPPAPSRR